MIIDVGFRGPAMRPEGNPSMKFFEIVTGAAERDAAKEPPERQDEFRERNGERQAANPFVVVTAQEEQRKRAERRQENQNREQRSGRHQRTIPATGAAAGQKKIIAMTTSAPMTTHTA